MPRASSREILNPSAMRATASFSLARNQSSARDDAFCRIGNRGVEASSEQRGQAYRAGAGALNHDIFTRIDAVHRQDFPRHLIGVGAQARDANKLAAFQILQSLNFLVAEEPK